MNSQSQPPNNAASAIIYLSGDRRGSTELLGGETCFVMREGRTGVRIARPGRSSDPTHGPSTAAVLNRTECGWDLKAMPDKEIWVNGKRVASRALVSGDVLEVAQDGPMLRYRSYEDGIIPRRSMSDVFADCRDGARYEQGPLVKKTGVLIGGITREFLNRTTLPFRIAVLFSLGAMLAVMAVLYQRNVALEQRIARSEIETEGLAVLVREGESKAITADELIQLRGELESNITTTVERVAAVEQRLGAASRVVSAASQSVIFLQGAYGFVHAPSGRPLRYVATGSSSNVRARFQGGRAVTLEGDGPEVELQYTGTGYVADDDGLIITNRHVAEPWRNEEFATVIEAMGLTPVMRKFVGYLPGHDRPFEVALAGVSEDADIAILRCNNLAGATSPLLASAAPARPGDEVIVLGFPTGVRAMLARTGKGFLDELRSEGDVNFWTIGERLAEAGQIAPLATRGIVGQVTSSAVVYDAETTHGGSGGPVLNLEGRVVAVNTAILKDFGGSNLGVPVDRVSALIGEVEAVR